MIYIYELDPFKFFLVRSGRPRTGLCEVAVRELTVAKWAFCGVSIANWSLRSEHIAKCLLPSLSCTNKYTSNLK